MASLSHTGQLTLMHLKVTLYGDRVFVYFCHFRTFLNTLEITLICVFTVIAVFLIIGLVIYLYIYGGVRPPCCEKPDKDYQQIQLQRERQIGEIWLRPPSGQTQTQPSGQTAIVRPAVWVWCNGMVTSKCEGWWKLTDKNTTCKTCVFPDDVAIPEKRWENA